MDLKDILSDSAVYSVGEGINKAAGVLLIPLYTAVLTQAHFGALELIGVTAALLSSISTLGVSSAFMRFYAGDYNDPEKLRSGFRHSASVILSGAALVGICLTVGSRYFASTLLGDASLYPVIWLLAALIVTEGMSVLSVTAVRIERKPLLYVKVSFLKLILTLSSVIYLVKFLDWGVAGVLTGGISGNLLVLLILIPRYMRLDIGFLRLSWCRIDEMLRFSVPLMLAGISFLVMTLTDRYMLRWLTTLEEVGIYGLAAKFGIVVAVGLVRPFQASATPILVAREKNPDTPRFAAHLTTYLWIVGLSVCLILSVSAPTAIGLAAGSKYLPAVAIVPWLVLGQLFIGLRHLMGYGLVIKNRTGVTSLIAAAGLVANFVLNYLFISRWGAVGAGIATLISAVFVVMLFAVISDRIYPVPYEWRRLIKSTLVLGGAGTLIYFTGFDTTAWALKLAIFASVPVALWALRFYKPGEIVAARSFLRLDR